MASAAEEVVNVQEAFIFTRLVSRVLETGKIQIVFFLVLAVLFPLLIPFLREVDGIIQLRKANNPSYQWPDYQDLWITLYTAAFIYLLKGLLSNPLRSLMFSVLQDKYTGKDREERAERSSMSAFKGIYFFFSSSFGYYVAKDSFFLSPLLGGSGAFDRMYDGFPYQPIDSFPLIRHYILIQLGYHLFSLVNHLASKPKGDFMEMLLHHCFTLVLVSAAYMMNYITITILILFTHDCPDLFVGTTRALADSKYKKLLVVSAMMLAITWGYMRLFIFPTYLIYYGYWYNHAETNDKFLLGWMLHVLYILNIYWFILIVKMIIRYTIKRRDIDIDHRSYSKKD